MKNIKLIIAALISFAALSCEKESLPQSTPESNLVPLVLTTGDDTKTSLQTDGSIYWSATDEIAVFDNSLIGDNKNKFTVSAISEANRSSATFTGSVGSTTTLICAVYPYELASSCDVGALQHKIQVTLPNQQVAEPGSFAENLNISIAKASVLTDTDKNGLPKTSISFKNVCALLNFKLPSSLPGTIKKVTISSATPIAGDMSLTYGDNISCSIAQDQSTQISMTGTFEPNQTYWFVLAPVTLKGISIDVETESGVYTKSNSSEITLTQGKYRSLGTLNFDKMKPITVSSEHVIDNNTLLGTNLTVNLPYSDISAINLTVKLGDKVVRTITDTKDVVNGVAKTKYDAAGNWPYLPCGDYNISGSYTTGFGNVNVDYSFSISEGPEKLNITSVNAYTSYTKYLESGADAANACDDGASVYMNQIAGISESILNKSHYAPYLKAKFDSGSEISAFFESAGEYRFSMYAYRQYNKVLLIFDGVESSSAVSLSECHVTGLPYVLDPAANDSINQWVTSGDVKWNNEDRGLSVRVGYALGSSINTESSSISKSFYLPSDITVSVSANAEARGSRVFRDITTTGSVSISGIVACTGSAKGKGTYVPFSCDSEEMTMTPSNPMVVCNNSNSTNEACTYFKSLVIYYADADAEDKL